MGQIKEIIEEHYANIPPRETKGKMPSASQLGGCPRVAYARYLGIPATTPPDVHAMQNFEVGNVTEAVIARAMDLQEILHAWWTDSQNYGSQYLQEEWTGKLRTDRWESHNLGFSGVPDMLCTVEGNNVVVDVKTSSTKSVPYILREIKNGTYWDNAYGYKLQLGAYMMLLEERVAAKEETFSADYGKLVIIDKNVGSIIAEPVLKLDNALRNEIITRAKFLNNIFASEKMPNCTCASGWMKHFGVAYCSYGNPETQLPNKQKKVVNTECCNANMLIEKYNEGGDKT